MALKYSLPLFLSIFVIISAAKPVDLSSILLPPSILPSSGIKGAYWPSWLAESLPPSTIPTSYFTHIFYAFVVPDATTYQLSITQTDDEWMANFTATLHAKNPPAKAFLSIGGANASPYTFSSMVSSPDFLSIGGANASPYTFSSMVSSPDNRAAFIDSTIGVARKYGFDGLDLDWESPNNPQDMSNLSTFFIEWRSGVNKESVASGKPRIHLAAAVYFSSHFFLSDPLRSYPGATINKYVDFVSPMCFDYHGGWDTSTGAPALLYDKSSNISTSYGISSWIKSGVLAEKLVMGMPMYGRTWKLKDPSEHKIGDPAVGTGPGNGGIMSYDDIVEFNLVNGATEVYDNETVSAYSYVGTNWIGYDNVESIQNKVKFAKDQGLGGYFLWVLGDDKNWTLSRAAFKAWDG